MRVLVLNGGLLSRYVVPAIRAQGYEPEVVDCTGDDGAMSRALAGAFSGDELFCTVEHDVEAPMGSLAWLEHCPDMWCFHGYDIRGRSWDELVEVGNLGWLAPLGLTRFRPEALRGALAPVLGDPGWADTWQSRDTLISRALVDAGITPHRHRPDAIHHHDYSGV